MGLSLAFLMTTVWAAPVAVARVGIAGPWGLLMAGEVYPRAGWSFDGTLSITPLAPTYGLGAHTWLGNWGTAAYTFALGLGGDLQLAGPPLRFSALFAPSLDFRLWIGHKPDFVAGTRLGAGYLTGPGESALEHLGILTQLYVGIGLERPS